MIAFASLYKIGCVALLTACASTSETTFGSEPEYDDSSAKIHPAAYGADGFTFRKTQNRRPANTHQFYFKHCNLISEGSYYSKTEYGCTEP